LHNILIILVLCAVVSALTTTIFCILTVYYYWKISYKSSLTPFQSLDTFAKTNNEILDKKDLSLIEKIKKIRFYFLMFFISTIGILFFIIGFSFFTKFMLT